MPEINPLTNNQIFLKKIAENTGSDYDTGDVSEINPLTIDQILLKEIAANTAGQSGDITELEGKVADNTAAIEAIVNVNGACNLCPTSTTTTTKYGITFTVNSDGSVTASGIADSGHVATIDIMPKTDLHYGTYKGSGGVNEHCRIIYGRSNSSGTLIDTVDDSGEGIELTVNASTPKVSMALIIDAGTDLTTPVTFYPMLYDARLNPTDYVPYAMTNRELTERIKIQQISVTTQIDGTCKLWHKSIMMMPIGFSVVTFPSNVNEINGSFTLSTNDYWYMMMKKSDGSIIAESPAVINIAYLSY